MWNEYGGGWTLMYQALENWRISLAENARFMAPLQHPVQRLVFVCSGNRCRSPFAQAYSARAGANSVSMGLRTRAGFGATQQARLAARRLKLNLNSHHTTPFSVKHLCDGDLILAFELWQAIALASQIKGCDKQVEVRLLGGFLSFRNYHIHDPIGHDDRYFDRCFRTIASGIERLLTQLGSQNLMAPGFMKPVPDTLTGVGEHFVPDEGESVQPS